MLKMLAKRLPVVVLLLILFNFATLLATGNNTLLLRAVNGFNAEGRLNSGTELVLRDTVGGVSETGTFESFSNMQIAALMDHFTENRLARSAIYRPEPTSLDELEFDDFEVTLVVESACRYYMFCDVTFTALSPGFQSSKSAKLFWLFTWHEL